MQHLPMSPGRKKKVVNSIAFVCKYGEFVCLFFVSLICCIWFSRVLQGFPGFSSFAVQSRHNSLICNSKVCVGVCVGVAGPGCKSTFALGTGLVRKL